MRLAHSLLFGVIALAFGCNDATDPADIAVSLVPSAPMFKAGDTLGITVSAINIDDEEHTITANTCPRPIQVFDSEGEEIDVRGELCNLSLLLVTLQPGESYTLQFVWDGRASNGTPVESGEYLLRTFIPAGDLGTLTGGTARVYVLP